MARSSSGPEACGAEAEAEAEAGPGAEAEAEVEAGPGAEAEAGALFGSRRNSSGTTELGSARVGLFLFFLRARRDFLGGASAGGGGGIVSGAGREASSDSESSDGVDASIPRSRNGLTFCRCADGMSSSSSSDESGWATVGS